MPESRNIALDERALVQAVRDGSPEACELLVRNYGGAMCSVARKILGDGSDADDAVQDAFLSAIRSLDRFEGRSSLATWLHRITANAALMKLRARQSHPTISVETLQPEFTSRGAWPAPVLPWRAPQEDPIVKDEICAHVHACIAKLPDKYRIPLLMHAIERVSNTEIARRLDISVNAAKIRVHRARVAVRELLDPSMAEDAP